MKKVTTIFLVIVLLFAACGSNGVVSTPAPEPTPAPTPAVTPMPTPVPTPLCLACCTPHGYLAMHHIKFMNDNLYGRSPFTYREKEAAAWLVEELLAMGHSRDNIKVQEFTWDRVSRLTPRWMNLERAMSEQMLGGREVREGMYSQNVILTIPGQSERKIIVGAHYDSLPYPGASDNASGTALLLESAQRMLHQDNYHTLVYIFFGAEEVGLLGAQYYVNTLTYAQRRDIVMMVNADVLFEGPYMVYVAGYVPSDRWQDGAIQPRTNDLTAQVGEIARKLYVRHSIDIIHNPINMFMGSDHLPFAWEGITVVVLAGWYQDYAGNFLLRVLHSPRDCIHYINEAWPGKAETNMRYFSIFLEKILLAMY